MKRIVGGGLVLTAAMLLGAASPPASVSPSSSPTPAPRPMLAPEGWMFATVWVGNETTYQNELRVMAVSPSGEIREVARLDPNVGDEDVREAGTVSVDGFLPITYEWSDEQGDDRELMRLFDLHDAAAPNRPDLDPPAGQDEFARTYAWSWGPDGRFTTDLNRPLIGGDSEELGVRLLIEPLTGARTRVVLPVDRAISVEGWLEDGTGWIAHRRDDSNDGAGEGGVVSPVDGSFVALEPPLQQLYLAGGAEPQSVDGLALWTTCSGPVGCLDPADRCQRISTAPAVEGWIGITRMTTWWDRCGRRARVLKVLWDIDGRGLPMFIERDRVVSLVRADAPGEHTLLTRFWRGDIGPLFGSRRTTVEVDGAMAGPRPGELLIAFHTSGNYEEGPLTLFSTIDKVLVPVGAQPGTRATFAGFSVPSIDG